MGHTKKKIFFKEKMFWPVTGPASQSPEKLYSMMENGMNIVRINLSHNSHEAFLLL